MTIGFLGPEGTYTDEAARQLFPNTTRMAYPSINAVFDAVAARAIKAGVVPIESLVQGPVTETLDNLFRYAGKVTIGDMLVLPIDHALGAWGNHRTSGVSCPKTRLCISARTISPAHIHVRPSLKPPVRRRPWR
jgi:prephenate dehydratase